jgi:hypothetical protein
MATGHYIQRKVGANGAELHQAADPNRDQSYFLFSTTPEQLDPICAFRWAIWHQGRNPGAGGEIRAAGGRQARQPGHLLCAERQLCRVIEKLRPGAADPGEIVDLEGNVLGEHRGVIHYTIGQRKGLGIGGLGDPLYVVKLDPATRRVIVGPKEALSTRVIPVREINWLGDEAFDSRAEWHLNVKVRSTRPPRGGDPAPDRPDHAEVELLDPEDGRQPGQACVFLRPRRQPHLGRRLDLERTRLVKSIVLALALALPLPATALPALAETREERVAAAQVYIDMALADFDMEAMIGMLYQPILDQVTAGGAVLTEDQLAKIKAALSGRFRRTPARADARSGRDHGRHVHPGRNQGAERFLRHARGQVGHGETAATDRRAAARAEPVHRHHDAGPYAPGAGNRERRRAASTDRAALRPGASPPLPSRSIVRAIACLLRGGIGQQRLKRRGDGGPAAGGADEFGHHAAVADQIDQRHRVDQRRPPHQPQRHQCMS